MWYAFNYHPAYGLKLAEESDIQSGPGKGQQYPVLVGQKSVISVIGHTVIDKAISGQDQAWVGSAIAGLVWTGVDNIRSGSSKGR